MEAARHYMGKISGFELELDFYLPEDFERFQWQLDLVNEGFFWFSERGPRPADMRFL